MKNLFKKFLGRKEKKKPEQNQENRNDNNILIQYLTLLYNLFNENNNSFVVGYNFAQFLVDSSLRFDPKNQYNVHQTTLDLISMIQKCYTRTNNSLSNKEDINKIQITKSDICYTFMNIESVNNRIDDNLQNFINNDLSTYLTKLNLTKQAKIINDSVSVNITSFTDNFYDEKLKNICQTMIYFAKGNNRCKYPISRELKNIILKHKKDEKIDENLKKNNKNMIALSYIFGKLILFLFHQEYGKNFLHKNVLGKKTISEMYMDDLDGYIKVGKVKVQGKQINITNGGNTIQFAKSTFNIVDAPYNYYNVDCGNQNMIPLDFYTHLESLITSGLIINVFFEYCTKIPTYVAYDLSQLNYIQNGSNISCPTPLQQFFQNVHEIVNDIDSELLKSLCKYIVFIHKNLSCGVCVSPFKNDKFETLKNKLINQFQKKGGQTYMDNDIKFLRYLRYCILPGTIEFKIPVNMDNDVYGELSNELKSSIFLLFKCSENPTTLDMLHQLEEYDVNSPDSPKTIQKNILKNYLNANFLPENSVKRNFSARNKIYFLFDQNKMHDETKSIFERDQIHLKLLETNIVKTYFYSYTIKKQDYKTYIEKIYRIEAVDESLSGDDCKLRQYLFKDPTGARRLFNNKNGITQNEFSRILSSLNSKKFDQKTFFEKGTTFYMVIGNFDKLVKNSQSTQESYRIYYPIMDIYNSYFQKYSNVFFGGFGQCDGSLQKNYYYISSNKTDGKYSSLRELLSNFKAEEFDFHQTYKNYFQFYDIVDKKLQFNSYFFNDKNDSGQCLTAYNNIKKVDTYLPLVTRNICSRSNDKEKLNNTIIKMIIEVLPDFVSPQRKQPNSNNDQMKNNILIALQSIVDKIYIEGKEDLCLSNNVKTFLGDNDKIKVKVNLKFTIEIGGLVSVDDYFCIYQEFIDFNILILNENHKMTNNIEIVLENVPLKRNLPLTITFSRKTGENMYEDIKTITLNKESWFNRNNHKFDIESVGSIDISSSFSDNGNNYEPYILKYFMENYSDQDVANQLYIYSLWREYKTRKTSRGRTEKNDEIFHQKYSSRDRKKMTRNWDKLQVQSNK